MYSAIPLTCQACRMTKPIACCFCDMELCLDCTPAHLAQCAYAKRHHFRTWRSQDEIPKAKRLSEKS